MVSLSSWVYWTGLRACVRSVIFRVALIASGSCSAAAASWHWGGRSNTLSLSLSVYLSLSLLSLSLSPSVCERQLTSAASSSSWRIKANLRLLSTTRNQRWQPAGQLPGSRTSCRRSLVSTRRCYGGCILALRHTPQRFYQLLMTTKAYRLFHVQSPPAMLCNADVNWAHLQTTALRADVSVSLARPSHLKYSLMFMAENVTVPECISSYWQPADRSESSGASSYGTRVPGS